VVTHQLQAERRTARACRPRTDVIPLDHATNMLAQISKKWDELLTFGHGTCAFSSRLSESARLMVDVQVRIDGVDERWSSSVMIGVVCLRGVRLTLPSSALDIRWPSWIICDDSVYKTGTKVCCALC